MKGWLNDHNIKAVRKLCENCALFISILLNVSTDMNRGMQVMFYTYSGFFYSCIETY